MIPAQQQRTIQFKAVYVGTCITCVFRNGRLEGSKRDTWSQTQCIKRCRKPVTLRNVESTLWRQQAGVLHYSSKQVRPFTQI